MSNRMGTYDRSNAYCMFAGALNGEIVLAHLGQRAWEVRHSIATLFAGDWKHARREGWRAVPVVVQERKSWLKRERG